MADGWVLLECIACGAQARLTAFSGGDWGLWSSLDDFIVKHTKCDPDKAIDMEASREGYPFFRVVTENAHKGH